MSRNFNVAPYFDDYDELKKFLKVLYRPGLAVQAREVTTTQSILQNQISRMGEFLFDEGSEVLNGQTELDLEYSYVKISSIGSDPQFGNITVSQIINFLSSKTLVATGVTSGVKAELKNAVDIEGADPITYFVKYRGQGDSGLNKTFLDGESINIKVYDPATLAEDPDSAPIEAQFTSVAIGTNATGTGSAVSIREGTRFSEGFFIAVDEQTFILDKYGNTPTAVVGLRIVEDIVTPEEDPSLLDNAQGSPNFSAPGAHRYRIRLLLDNDPDEDPQNFIRIITLKDGIIQEDIRQAQLAQPGIEKELARRTEDTNGNFTVEEFRLEVREHLNDGTNRGVFTAEQGGDEAKLALDVDSGRAYVNGFEIKTTGAEIVELDKARDTATYNNAVVGATYGAYCLVDTLQGSPDILGFATVDLYDGANQTGSIIGTARVRNIELQTLVQNGNEIDPTSVWRTYLFDIKLTGGNVFDNVLSMGGTSASFGAWTANLTATSEKLVDRTNSMIVEQLPFNVVQQVSDVSYSVRRAVASSLSSGVLVFNAPGGETFEPKVLSNYALKDVSSGEYFDIFTDDDILSLSTDFKTLTIDMNEATPPIADNRNVVLYYTANKNSADNDRKVKSRNTETKTVNSPVFTSPISLDKADIIRIVSVTDLDTTTDITDSFSLDNGQRDGYYGIGSISALPTADLGTPSQIEIVFEYYQHSSGDYFTAESYPTADFEDIPVYTSSFGESISLRDAMDFRPILDVADTSISDVFIPNSTIRGDVSYYLSRIDKVSINKNGEFIVIKGAPALSPVAPPTPSDGMTILEIDIPAYTFNPEDVELDYIENKRYTMRDIGKLENRIENLEYYTTLNLLEQSVAQKTFTDGLGDEQFKNGFLVDSFAGHSVGDTSNTDFHCSIDQNKGELRPECTTANVELALNETDSAGYQKTGDLITLPYTVEPLVEQPLASRTENVNPFEVFLWEGSVSLTPNNDTWVETRNRPAIVVNREGNFNNITNIQNPSDVLKSTWNCWQSVWRGQPRSIFGVFRSRGAFAGRRNVRFGVSSFGRKARFVDKWRTQTTQRVVREVVDDRLVDVTFVPFLRSKTIQFSARGMKPETVVYPFFDDVNVSAYVTPSTLITDAAGNVSGTFTIPNEDGLRFRAGQRAFTLSDSETKNVDEQITNATTFYQGRGSLETRQQTIESTRVVEQRFIQQPVNWNDPIAQSFLVRETGGCFITDIDLYFETKDEQLPVTVQIREMENGVPTQKIIPFGNVTLEPSQVNTSVDGTIATNFAFESPVFLQDQQEYCFVVLANSTKYNMFVSRMGENDLVTELPISKQPYAGVMFKSQNNSTWSPDQLQDVKFVINRAVFDTNSVNQVVFENVNAAPEELDFNPIFTTDSSAVIKVRQPDHGMQVDSIVEFSNAGIINNVDVDGTWRITGVISNDLYTAEPEGATGGTASADGWSGGSGILATRDFPMDLTQAIIEQLTPDTTDINWQIRTTNSRSVNGSTLQTPYLVDASYIDFDINDNFLFDSPKKIASGVNETSQPNMSGAKSVLVKAVLQSDNSNISPVIDTGRTALIAVGNRTSAPADISDETAPSVSGSENVAGTRYITSRISLDNAATSVKVIFDAHRQSGAEIEVYVKTLGSDVDEPFSEQNWTLLDKEIYPTTNSDISEFSEYQFGLDNLPEFNLWAVKIVMTSNNSALPPRVRSMRAIALA